MADSNAKELCQRAEKLFSARTSTLNLWQEIAENFYPERADFTITRSSQYGFADHLFATDPVMMRRDLANAISAMTRPSDRQWGKPQVEDDQLNEADGVREYLDYLGKVQWRAMYDPKALFIRSTKEADHDLVTFGNAVMSSEPNMQEGRLLYRTWHIRDCAWADNSDGVVDLLYRKMKLHARTAMQMFSQPGDVLHESIKKACEKDPTQEFEFMHCMMPAKDYEYVSGNKPKVKMPFVSVYVDVMNKQVVRERPSYEFRYIVQRWQTIPGVAYAVSPATLTALPDARMMQALSRIIMEAGEKSVDPPMKATEEAVKGQINLYAGGTTWVDREYDEKMGPAIEPIPLGTNAGLGVNLFDRIQMIINNAFYLNKLALPQSQGKTAYETAQLVEESLRASAPLFEPMEANNALILDQTMTMLQRVGAFGPPQIMPPALQGKTVTFSFSNPLHDAIERAKVMQFQGLAGLIQVGSQLDPTITADVDARQAFRDAVEGSGAPAQWLREKKVADAAAAQQQKMQQMGQLAAAAHAGGQAAQSVGKGVQALTAPAPMPTTGVAA